MKQKFFYVAVVIGMMALPTVLSAYGINNLTNPDGSPVIVPTVQRYEARQGVLPLPAELTVSAPAAADNEAELFLKLSKRYFPDRRAARVENGAFCRLELYPVPCCPWTFLRSAYIGQHFPQCSESRSWQVSDHRLAGS